MTQSNPASAQPIHTLNLPAAQLPWLPNLFAADNWCTLSFLSVLADCCWQYQHQPAPRHKWPPVLLVYEFNVNS
jgi:hypothetical protein